MADNLAMLRTKLGLTQVQLAIIGILRNTSIWLSNTTNPEINYRFSR